MDKLFLWIGSLITVKMSILPQIIYKFSATPCQMLTVFVCIFLCIYMYENV